MAEILTVGYEGSQVADFVAVLSSLKVEVLCDLRDVTASRIKGFSKTPLSDSLAKAGIEYVHFRALGDPKEGRVASRSGNRALFLRIFGEHLASATAQSAVAELAELVSRKKACLMCFERSPLECHRKIVADLLNQRYGHNIRHIGVPKDFAM